MECGYAASYPVNSSFDDIGFLINDRMNGAYFSSNRPGGKGKDDIYHLEQFRLFL